ncbi:unnamed protein product [Euphydryas editha]|uniref:Uncharacterized protein n=1 Tax=Euphydryas editha TaxID=104508 RepID=A0AAU9USD3_EUPED|nr:unnamed protein product [Euphydryas editha]
MSKEIDIRIGNAWKSCLGVKEIMKNKETKMFIKTKLYNVFVLPDLTYGCQIWALTIAQNANVLSLQKAIAMHAEHKDKKETGTKNGIRP